MALTRRIRIYVSSTIAGLAGATAVLVFAATSYCLLGWQDR
jgi:hypothetical protein